MADENPRDVAQEVWRWMVLMALLIACLTAYFRYAPKVPPVIEPIRSAESS